MILVKKPLERILPEVAPDCSLYCYHINSALHDTDFVLEGWHVKVWPMSNPAVGVSHAPLLDNA